MGVHPWRPCCSRARALSASALSNPRGAQADWATMKLLSPSLSRSLALCITKSTKRKGPRPTWGAQTCTPPPPPPCTTPPATTPSVTFDRVYGVQGYLAHKKLPGLHFSATSTIYQPPCRRAQSQFCLGFRCTSQVVNRLTRDYGPLGGSRLVLLRHLHHIPTPLPPRPVSLWLALTVYGWLFSLNKA